MSENQKWPRDSHKHLVKLSAAHRAGRWEKGLSQPAHGAQELSAAQLLLCSFISATVLLQVLKSTSVRFREDAAFSDKHREHLQHTASLRIGRLADYNHISSYRGCTEGLPPEMQDSSGNLTLPSASSPSSTDEGHHHDPRDSIKAYWDPVASIKTSPA